MDKILGWVEEGRSLADAEVSLKSQCAQVPLLERWGGALKISFGEAAWR